MRSFVLDFKYSEFIRGYLKDNLNVTELRIALVGARLPSMGS